MRWLLIDEFKTIQKGSYAKGIRSVTRSEDALAGHYPCVPVMPASLLIEMMAQVTGVLVGATIDFKKEVVLAKVTDARFLETVLAPATLEIEGRLLSLGEDGACCEGKVSQSGRLVAQSVIFFGLFPNLKPGTTGPVVFSKNFMESYAIRKVIESAVALPQDHELHGSRS